MYIYIYIYQILGFGWRKKLILPLFVDAGFWRVEMGGSYEKIKKNGDVGGDACCDPSEETDPVNRTKGKKLWKKVKYELIGYHSLPAYLKDNEYILNHYRAEWPLAHILRSVFLLHNETGNVWTHLIGFFLFLGLSIYTAQNIPIVDDLHPLQRLANRLPNPFSIWGSNGAEAGLLGEDGGTGPITRWPFFAFLGGAMFCLLASSACHLLSCHSRHLSYVMLRLDYAGIAALITASFYPPVYYSFMCNPFFCRLYLATITALGLATILFSLLPVFQKPEFRPVRASLFFGMGLSGAAPVAHKLILFRHRPEALVTTGYELLMGALYGVGALIYATRVPERWRPGKFDLAGHSHQLFHVLVVAGAFAHYRAGLVYLEWRDAEGC
uniref:Heptahelical transmembrane protein 4-like n=2 Tax=Kalanchoe fedtschenkoi TaxID=63787 RepID=A0A7N0T5G7_KALFE